MPPVSPGLDSTLVFTADWWNQTTVPLLLLVVIFPMLNLRHITFFTRLNALGVVSILYLLWFVGCAAVGGFNDSPFGGVHMGKDLHVELASVNAFSLVGVLTLSYFLHTGALSILRNAAHPENNIRDLRVAYGLGCGTYLFVGACLYVSFKVRRSLLCASCRCGCAPTMQ